MANVHWAGHLIYYPFASVRFAYRAVRAQSQRATPTVRIECRENGKLYHAIACEAQRIRNLKLVLQWQPVGAAAFLEVQAVSHSGRRPLPR